MAPAETGHNSWSTHDIACSHCRDRKIRCGRERPQCANCKRDGMECDYSTPSKRVNHVKLLCDHVGSLQNRLSNIEEELSRLITLLKQGGIQTPFLGAATEGASTMISPAENECTEDSLSAPPTGRHIVRSESDFTDRYHGPCTLFALCKDMYDTTLPEERTHTPHSTKDRPQHSKKQDSPGKSVAVKDLLARMCHEAGIEDSLNFQSDHIAIQLPPKQLLMMVQTQFFQQADYATDIFVQSCFWPNVERIYCQTFTTADEAWAICFNTIILLVLGSEMSNQNNGSVAVSQLAIPFLLPVRAALSNPRVLMEPKLINVQALTLLSVVSQQYYPPALTETIFAQACVLARMMGLHQAHAKSEAVGPEEMEARFKVFRSLYLRDKSFAISRGSICWLPSSDCCMSLELGQMAPANSNCTARIQLARLQEDIYLSFHSARSHRPSSAKYKNALSRIEQGLEGWANAHDIFSSSGGDARDVALLLEFLAARISVFRGSFEPSHIRRALYDARASCLLLLISYGKHDQSMVERLEALLLCESPTKSRGEIASPQTSTSTSSDRDISSTTAKENTNQCITLRFQSLLYTFSVPAFFLLVKNVILPSPADQRAQAEEDIILLQKACACYKELDARTQANSYTRKVGRAFERLLEVVNLMNRSEQTSIHGTRQSSSIQTLPNTQDVLGGSQNFFDLAGLPDLSTCSIPPLPWDRFLAKKTSTKPTDPWSGLLTPMELESIGQPYDAPLPQYSFSPQFQHQIGSPPSRKRVRLDDSDVYRLDFPDGAMFPVS